MARTLRAFLLGLFVFGAVGVSLELLLLEHYEKWWQRLPLVLLVTGVSLILWQLTAPSRLSVRCFQLVLWSFVVSGLVGLWLHYKGNMEFELEMVPSLAPFELFLKASHGAFPALAPGTMIQLGMLGLAYTFRHPVLRKPRSK